MILTCSFCSFTQAALESDGGRNGVVVFSAAQCRKAFHGLGFQHVTEIGSH
jgi:hypothetical protein